MDTIGQPDFVDILQLCLERIENVEESLASVLGDFPELADILRPELEAALWIRQKRNALDPRPGFVSSSRRRLLQKINAEKVQVVEHDDKQTRLSFFFGRKKLAFGLAFAVILTLFLVGGVSSAAQAWQIALPGDALYPVKLRLEDASLALNTSPERDAELHIEYAQRRLNELHTLAQNGRYAELPGAAANLEGHVDHAVSILNDLDSQNPAEAEALATKLRVTLEAQTRLAANFADTAPEQARLQFEQVMNASQLGLTQVQQVLMQATATPTQTSGILTNATSLPTAFSNPTATRSEGSTSKATLTQVVTGVGVASSTPAIVGPSTTPVPAYQAEATKTPHPTNVNRPTQKSDHPQKPDRPENHNKPERPRPTKKP